MKPMRHPAAGMKVVENTDDHVVLLTDLRQVLAADLIVVVASLVSMGLMLYWFMSVGGAGSALVAGVPLGLVALWFARRIWRAVATRRIVRFNVRQSETIVLCKRRERELMRAAFTDTTLYVAHLKMITWRGFGINMYATVLATNDHIELLFIDSDETNLRARALELSDRLKIPIEAEVPQIVVPQAIF